MLRPSLRVSIPDHYSARSGTFHWRFASSRGVLSRGAVFLCLWLGPGLVSCGPIGLCDQGILASCFASDNRVQWGFAPDTLIVDDVDRDGHPDIATASHERGSITVIWGDASSFGGTATTWSIAPTIAGLAIADLDDDGSLDIATAVPGDDAVSVLFGQGERAFDPASQYPTGSGPRAVMALELDGERPSELVTLNAGDGSMSVLFRLAAQPRIVIGPEPRGVAAGDLNGDGKLDVAVSLAARNGLQILFGDGDGGFILGPFHPVGGAPHGVAVADFDDNGALDLASANSLSDTVSVLFGDGEAGVLFQADFSTEPEPWSLAVVHNSAGRPTLGVLSQESSAVQRIDPLQGDAQVGTSTEWANGLAAGDLDGDGEDEVVYGSSSGQVGRIVAGNSLLLSSLWQGPPRRFAAAVDLGGDAIEESVVTWSEEIDQTHTLEVWRDGSPVEVIDARLDEAVLGALAVELTGDDRRDLVVWGAGGATVLVQGAGGALVARAKYPVAESIAALIAGDADGDGKSEVLIAGALAGYTELHVLASDSDGALSPLAVVPIPSVVRSLAAIGNDGSGSVDVALLSGPQLGILENAGLGAPPQWSEIAGVTSAHFVALADLNENGRLDALVCTGAELVYLADPFGKGAKPAERLSLLGCDNVIVSDLDADGRLDFISSRQEVRGHSVRAVITPWLRTEDSWLPRGGQAVHAATVMQFAQLDGDGIPDILLSGDDVLTEAFRMTLGAGLEDSVLVRLGVNLTPKFFDLDGDGALDMFAYGSGIATAWGDGHGGFEPLQRKTLETPVGDAQKITSAVVVDLDTDGAHEVILAAQHSRSWSTALTALDVHRDGRIDERHLDFLARGEIQLEVADLDGDGATDLLASGGNPVLELSVYYGDGRGQLRPAISSRTTVPSSFRESRLAEFDGDGLFDLVAVASDGVMLNAGRGRGDFADSSLWSQVTDVSSFAIGDLDDDGQRDLAVIAQGRLLKVEGAHAMGPPKLMAPGVSAVTIADLNHDGRSEVVAAGPGVGDDRVGRRLFIGARTDDSAYVFSNRQLLLTNPTGIEAVDLDGDGDLELAILGPETVLILRRQP